MIKSVAFDLGDTLILITAGFKKTLESNVEFNFLKKMNPLLSIDDYNKAVKKGMACLRKMTPAEKHKKGAPALVLLNELGLESNEQIAAEMANAFFEEQKRHTELFPDAKEILETLKKKNLILGVICNGSYSKAIAWLEFFNIKKYFDIIIASDQFATEKSGLEPFQDFLKKAEKYNIKPEEILMIGNDMKEDTSAKLLGLKVAILKPTITKHKKEIPPDYLIENLEEILEILNKKE